MPQKQLITTSAAMSLTGWSSATLTRRVNAGQIHSHIDPRDKRRTLYDYEELVAVAFPNPNQHRPAAEYSLEDVAMVQFADLLAAYAEDNREVFLEKVRETPVSLLPLILEMSLYLAHNSIEDEVSNATPEQVEAARIALAEDD